MRHIVEWLIITGPLLERFLVFPEAIQLYSRAIAVQANEAVIEQITGDHRHQWRAAAFNPRIIGRHIHHALVPDLAFVGHLSREPVRGQQRMR